MYSQPKLNLLLARGGGSSFLRPFFYLIYSQNGALNFQAAAWVTSGRHGELSAPDFGKLSAPDFIHVGISSGLREGDERKNC